MSPVLGPYLGLATLSSFALVWYLERARRRLNRSFKSSSQVLALGLPAVPRNTGDSSEERHKVISEFQKIGEEYKRHYAAIEAARSDFFLSNGIYLADQKGGARFIARPSRLLTCDVILGDSLASADLTPGSTIYWLRVLGSKLDEVIKADPSIVLDLSKGRTRMLTMGDFRIEVNLDGARLIDRRRDGLGEVQLELGTPMLLSLDDESEKALEEAFGNDAPAKGTSRKVRLFGGFQVDRTGLGIEIVPYRQQPGMEIPVMGRMHPLSGLLGVVVGEARDKAFVWGRSEHNPVAMTEAYVPPHSIAALQTFR